MIFSVEDRLFEYLPGLALGVLVVKVDNTRYGDDILESSLTRVRAAFANQSIEEHPNVKIWREAFTKVGMSDGPYRSSIESLLMQALQGGVFPRVNPLVDLYTAVSLDFLVPVGGHDISALEGDIRLAFAKGSEPFTPMEGGEDEVAAPGEVIYRDDHSALTRGWVWRQSNKDRVSTDSTSVFVPVDILDGLSWTMAEDVTHRITTYLHDHRIGEVVYRDILTRQKTFAEFTT
jgi:DNA/RNA-binding domain of Phe-tRNA-synthetase-like protein